MACVYCRKTEGPLHRDHVVPPSRGGPDEPHNIVTACQSCNSSKGNHIPSEWISPVPDSVMEIERRVLAELGDIGPYIPPGPPPKRPGAPRRNIVHTKLADDELAACKRLARAEGKTLSEWAREAALDYIHFRPVDGR